MPKVFLKFILLISCTVFSQNLPLANSFFKNGEYKKALIEYNKILKKEPFRTECFLKKIKCHQELKQYKIAHKELTKKIKTNQFKSVYFVELGYNYSLQKDIDNATKAFKKAINLVQKKPSEASSVGKRFENYNLLSEAENTYLKALAVNERANFDYQLAKIYGQQNKIEKMFEFYLKIIEKSRQNENIIQNIISKFLNDDSKNKNNILFKKTILKNMQNGPNPLWNEQLSWLFIQEKQFNKAFTQEKALYKRENYNLNRIYDLGIITNKQKDYETAMNIFSFIENKSIDQKIQINVALILIEMKEINISKKDYNLIKEEYQLALNNFGINNKTINIQLSYAKFLAFKKKEIELAINFLNKNKNNNLTKFNKARLEMALADILVANNKFNQALINYTKVERAIKNNPLGQEAIFKIAKTSYYKGDFDWALQQLSVLKKSTSQLIANDALNLHLLIKDHNKSDSLNIALKKYSKADHLAFKNKNIEALKLLDSILNNHPTDKIIDDTLFFQAKLYELENNNLSAKENYLRIINNLKESIFVDDALFNLAKLELNLFNNTENASIYLERIIFNHADSIHFIEAKNMYRKLRGDNIESSSL